MLAPRQTRRVPRRQQMVTLDIKDLPRFGRDDNVGSIRIIALCTRSLGYSVSRRVDHVDIRLDVKGFGHIVFNFQRRVGKWLKEEKEER